MAMMGTVVAGVITLALWAGMIYGLTRLKNKHDALPDDLRTLDSEALLAFMTAEYNVSEYRIFQAQCRSRFGRIIDPIVDESYELWLRKRKMPDSIRVFMLDVLEGRQPFRDTLVV